MPKFEIKISTYWGGFRNAMLWRQSDTENMEGRADADVRSHLFLLKYTLLSFDADLKAHG